tara:strand:- start:106 stop:510 length:405 start_codon:yes stop_codon:yes gene_type:complete
MSEKKKKSGEKMYGERIVNPVTGHVSHKPTTHKSRGKAGKVPHPVGLSPHSGARKNKLRKAIEAREDKIQRATPTVTAPKGSTKRRPTSKEKAADKRQYPSVLKKAGGKVKGYKHGGFIGRQLDGGKIVSGGYD